MIDPIAGGLVKEIAIAVAAAAAVWATMRRDTRRDATDAADDGAHVGMISRLQHERDAHAKRADDAEEEARRERDFRLADREKIARLESRCESLTEANGRLTASVRRFAGTLPKEVQRLVVTDFAGFDERPETRGPA